MYFQSVPSQLCQTGDDCFHGNEVHSLLIPFSKELMKVKKVSNLSRYMCHIDTVLGKLPPRKVPNGKFPPIIVPPGKSPLGKFPLRIFPTISLIVFLHLALPTLMGGRVYIYILPGGKFLVSLERLNVPTWEEIGIIGVN